MFCQPDLSIVIFQKWKKQLWKMYIHLCQFSALEWKLTNENYLDDSSSADFIDVIAFKGMISVGELYTFLYLNVIKEWGVSTNQRLNLMIEVYLRQLFRKRDCLSRKPSLMIDWTSCWTFMFCIELIIILFS